MTDFPTDKNRRILIVDDTPAIHGDFRKILLGRGPSNDRLDVTEAKLFGFAPSPLKDEGFEIDSAFQGKEALARVEVALAEGRPYGLAFIDVRMPPGWDGVETVRRLWAVCPELQVVLCTAYSDYAWDEIVAELGNTDNLVVLRKPFDNVEVLQLAHALTKKWVLTRQASFKVDFLNQRVEERTRELSESNERVRQEVNERRAREEELRESEDRFSAAFHASPVAIEVSTLSEGRVVDVNEAFLRMMGFDRDEVVGRTEESLGIWADGEARRALLLRFYEPDTVRDVQCRFRTKDGKIRDTLVSAEPINLSIGRCILLTLHDVTERVSLEGQLRQAQKMEAIGQLAGGVAHDFNNLLTIITGHTHVQLAEGELEPTVAESLREISEAAQAAAQLTRQLLAFGRKQVLQPKAVDLNALVANMLQFLERLVEETIEVDCVYEPNLPAILADSGMVEQVVMNLGVNARDAMTNGGRLTLSTFSEFVDDAARLADQEAAAGLYVGLAVSDTGCGIDAATRERMFEPFFTTKEVGRGTGLGLSTVYGIVKQHRGWIEVESEVGRGSRFKVFLPASEEAKTVLEKGGGRAPEMPRGAETILLVEDENGLRSLVAKVLENSGYRVLQASSGVDALEIWKTAKEKTDLLLTDVVMPHGVSGTDLAERLCREQPALKVIYTSGYHLASERNSLPHGLTLLPKPYHPSTLARVVRRCLDGKSLPALAGDHDGDDPDEPGIGGTQTLSTA